MDRTFFHPLREETVHGWLASVPEDFVFSLQAPKTITHFRLLRDACDEVEKFFRSAQLLGSRLGPVLFTLPRSMHKP